MVYVQQLHITIQTVKVNDCILSIFVELLFLLSCQFLMLCKSEWMFSFVPLVFYFIDFLFCESIICKWFANP